MTRVYSKKEKLETVKKILEIVGEDPNRDGLKDTPKRIVKMWEEIFRGNNQNKVPNVTLFDNGKDGIFYDQMIFDEGNFYSICEHHMIPFFGKYYFAYIPHKHGKILGLSKVAKVVDYFSARLQLQERLVHQIVEFLWKELTANGYQPLGIGLVMTAEHLCKSMRGVKKEGRMRCSSFKGVIKEDHNIRMEFFNWVDNHAKNQ